MCSTEYLHETFLARRGAPMLKSCNVLADDINIPVRILAQFYQRAPITGSIVTFLYQVV